MPDHSGQTGIFYSFASHRDMQKMGQHKTLRSNGILDDPTFRNKSHTCSRQVCLNCGHCLGGRVRSSSCGNKKGMSQRVARPIFVGTHAPWRRTVTSDSSPSDGTELLCECAVFHICPDNEASTWKSRHKLARRSSQHLQKRIDFTVHSLLSGYWSASVQRHDHGRPGDISSHLRTDCAVAPTPGTCLHRFSRSKTERAIQSYR